ncbi:MAG: glycoside hydrolase family 2 protein [Oscillospiraceae bacterium]|nr:glycoside hydrolase family 2 protein [Oscillospiraceae bacterium]
MKQSLNGMWRLSFKDREMPAKVPGSLCEAMLENGFIDDPYYGENEEPTFTALEGDCVYTRKFDLAPEIAGADKILLRFHGIDTVSEVELNGKTILSTDNMHRTYTADITELVHGGGNSLAVKIKSPVEYITRKNEQTPLWGVDQTIAGFPHIRKAHCMLGWDWGPKLPDMGIWRGVELIGVYGGLIDGVFVHQDHRRIFEGIVELDINADLAFAATDELTIKAVLNAPDGSVIEAHGVIKDKATLHMTVNNAELWYPRGYGEHPLYALCVTLIDENGTAVDEQTFEIGLRTVTVSRAKLKKSDGTDNGEEFAFVVNGVKIFAMGANYVPEDQILPRRNAENTLRLLNACCDANYNTVRAWGGGIYPDDWFYEQCDRLGLLVWQDCMFACAVFKADEEFTETVRAEITDNAKRIRNHACLAMWCGNNEVETMWRCWAVPEEQQKYREDYLRLFENVIPETLRKLCPDTFYWSSSPSSGGNFDNCDDESRGDQHYWAVWHSLRPFEDYYDHEFRFCSEFGFESLPPLKTILSFAEERDLNICSPVMEAHQKGWQGTEKIMFYLTQMAHYPYDFEGLIYATQTAQADAIRINVENMRRNRAVCSGSLYWQVNDSNPTISWSSIDYFLRRKQLHYCAKRFYAPVLISADDRDPDNIRINVSSEWQAEFAAEIVWRSRRSDGSVIAEGNKSITVKPLAAEYFVTLTPNETDISPADKDKAYIEYSLIENGRVIGANTCMLVRAKQFRFADPKLTAAVMDTGDRFEITVTAEAFAKGVWLDLKRADCVFSDNFFDLHKGSAVVFVEKSSLSEPLSLEQFAGELTAVSYFEALKLQ